MAFDDMGPNWVAVRDGARDGSLRKNDSGVQEIAVRWDQLLRYASLHLGAQIGEDVQQVFARTHRDPKVRVADLIDSLCSSQPLTGGLRVPNTAGDIELTADLKGRRITASMTIDAPEDRGGRARCSWILGQIKDAPADLLIEAYPKNARVPNTANLSAASDDRDLLLGADKRDPARFRLVLIREMGSNRKAGDRSAGFIDSMVNLIETFYGTVVQNVTTWTPKAPKISASPARGAGGDHNEDEPDQDSMEQQSPFRFPQATPFFDT